MRGIAAAMRITFKTAGIMAKYLPAGAGNNVAEIEVAAGATPLDVMAQLGIPAGGVYLVTHNGMAVPIAKRPGLILAEGDTLAIMPPLKGG